MIRYSLTVYKQEDSLMSWKFGQAINIGKRSEQQDRLGLFSSKNGTRHLLVVADGMGGLEQGAKAAQIVINTAEHAFSQGKITNPELFLENIIHQAHQSINALKLEASTVPGTTCVLLYLDKTEAYWAHIGDSRLYHFRQGLLINRTVDHSAMQLMIDQGLVEDNSDEANALQNQLYKRLGGDNDPEPDFNSCDLEPGDLFMLCSDGLWQAIEDKQVLGILEEHPLDQDGPEQLINLALKNGGSNCDNISVMLSENLQKPQKSYLGKVSSFFKV